MRGRGANKEEAERAVTRGTGFTSEFPPPGFTSYQARCRLVIGWIKEREGAIFFFLHNEWAGVQSSQPENRASSPSSRGVWEGRGWVLTSLARLSPWT